MMARTSRHMHARTLLLLLAPLAARAQLSSVPNLSTATNTQGSTSAQTTGKTTPTSDGTKTTNNDASSTQGTFKLTDAPNLSTGSSSSAGLGTGGTLTNTPYHLTGLPTIAGAGIPTLVIPYTANAPFMQKSSLPEGTFFIAVGGVLAFLGACVLLWRLLVAWSINRSVRRTALASMQLNEKQPRSGSYWRNTSNNSGYNRVSNSGKGPSAFYKDVGGASTVTLDNLTSTGKISKPNFRDTVTERHTSNNAPPPNLFFSPTAHAAQNRDPVHRNSGYMPSGYYASAAAAQPAGGHNSTTVGGLAPGHHSNRYSAMSGQSGPSPPSSPGLPPQYRGSTIAPRDIRSRDGQRAPPSRDGLSSNRNSAYLYNQPSTSSLMVGSNSVSDFAPSRAPSAYLEELFDNHGHGPRERF